MDNKLTPKQQERQKRHNRERDGKYAKMNHCEDCGVFVGDEYWSLEDCNKTGVGLVLCKSCCIKKSHSDLNEIEKKVLKSLFESSEGNGHDFGFTDDVTTESIGITRRQLSGYISQLAQKDYIHVHGSIDSQKKFIQFTFTKKGFMFFNLPTYAAGSEY